jgi:hypothetical protein
MPWLQLELRERDHGRPMGRDDGSDCLLLSVVFYVDDKGHSHAMCSIEIRIFVY